MLFEGPLYPPLFVGSLHIRKPNENMPAQRGVSESDARAKNKGPTPKQCEVDSSDDKGINYSTSLDNLPITEDLFSGINFFNLASSVENISRDSSCNFDWHSLDDGTVSYLFASFFSHVPYTCAIARILTFFLFDFQI